ncbi:MAG: hypothetical protein M1818_002169 [Claussenomyces sp. TS43310]|nr:MAG: hypothetical protein M1818_002169 [Claussenomyces sp. TS43310]
MSEDSARKTLADVPPEITTKDVEIATARGNVITKEGTVVTAQETDENTSVNIFSDPEVEAHFTAIYEKARYECRHVFDSKLTWSREEERKLVRRLDWHGIDLIKDAS